jgi:ActR/RegA family two-component response regulator
MPVMRRRGLPLPNAHLAGRLILLVEDEPLVALDVEKALRAAGARVVSAGYVESGLYTTKHPDLSAAVVDLGLGDGNGMEVCRRLRDLGIPFVIHTGFPTMLIASEWPDVPVISKPADVKQIVDSLTRLIV